MSVNFVLSPYMCINWRESIFLDTQNKTRYFCKENNENEKITIFCCSTRDRDIIKNKIKLDFSNNIHIKLTISDLNVNMLYFVIEISDIKTGKSELFRFLLLFDSMSFQIKEDGSNMLYLIDGTHEIVASDDYYSDLIDVVTMKPIVSIFGDIYKKYFNKYCSLFCHSNYDDYLIEKEPSDDYWELRPNKKYLNECKNSVLYPEYKCYHIDEDYYETHNKKFIFRNIENERRLYIDWVQNDDVLVRVKKGSLWKINNFSYLIVSIKDDNCIYIGIRFEIPFLCLCKCEDNKLDFKICNNGYVIFSGFIDSDFNKNYCESRFDSNKNQTYLMKSQSEISLFDKPMNVYNVYFNKYDKITCYIHDDPKIGAFSQTTRVNVGYTKTWFLCAMMCRE